MKKWNLYTAKEIKADGWLKQQLEIQADGLSGNLDKVWRDVRDSKWIGGDAEGWERVPYWLDGFIPLAYLLEDENMIATAKKYIDAIIARQSDDGWICPCSEAERGSYDTWAVQLISKILVVYFECSGDERIPTVVYRILKNYHDLLKNNKIKLFDWGKFRWFEAFIAIEFTYKHFPEDWLLELSSILKENGTDYNELMSLWKTPLYAWKLSTHIVNIAMSLKYEAVSCDFTKDEYTDRAEALYETLYKYNGTPVGLFTGDECLAGLSPIHGTELCAVVEQMYSYELLYAYTGDAKWAERLELLAFNALPAALSDDMWSHQYDQLSNQIACKAFPGKSYFGTNSSDAHIFGLEPNFGCCTANFNQGWPKFVLSSFMHNDDTIISSVPVPSVLTCDKAKIKLETDYPFKNTFKYTVEAEKDFKFLIRIPSFAENLTVDSVFCNDRTLSFSFDAGEKREILISFETAPRFEKRPYNLSSVKCGSLVFSVPVKYKKEMLEYEKCGVERKFPYCDYEYIPLTDWNYAYSDNKLSLNTQNVDSIPFSSENPPVTVKAKVRSIDWGLEYGYDSLCSITPNSTEPYGEEKEISLYPYGCAKLRMTEIPLLKKQ